MSLIQVYGKKLFVKVHYLMVTFTQTNKIIYMKDFLVEIINFSYQRKGKSNRQGYVVTGNYGDFVIAVRQIKITNPCEWRKYIE